MADDSLIESELLKLQDIGNDFVQLNILTCPERLRAFLSCQRIAGAPPHRVSAAELRQLISEHLCPEFIDDASLMAISERLNRGQEVTPRRVAKGKAPKHGQDGKLVMSVKVFQPHAQEIDRERKNLRNLHLFDNLESGAEVARLLPPTAGLPGVDVQGKPIAPVAGVEFKPLFDASIELEPQQTKLEYQRLLAKSDGYLTRENGKLSIINELRIVGDVDYKSGNIDFVGSVQVTGSVLPDFEVIAGGSIQIMQHVQGGYLETTNGDIVVTGNIVGCASFGSIPGSRKATTKRDVVCEGRLSALRLQGASVESAGDIEVKREVMNSQLRTRASIFIPEGQLLGGKTYTHLGLEALVIGSPAASPTLIYLASNTRNSKRYLDLSGQITTNQGALKLVQLRLGPYDKASAEQISAIKEPTRNNILKLRKALADLQTNMDQLVKEQRELQDELECLKSVSVNFKQMLYRGVKVSVDGNEFEVLEDTPGPKSLVYLFEEKTFKLQDYMPLEREEKPKKNKQA